MYDTDDASCASPSAHDNDSVLLADTSPSTEFTLNKSHTSHPLKSFRTPTKHPRWNSGEAVRELHCCKQLVSSVAMGGKASRSASCRALFRNEDDTDHSDSTEGM